MAIELFDTISAYADIKADEVKARILSLTGVHIDSDSASIFAESSKHTYNICCTTV